MLTEKDYCDKDLSDALKESGFPTKMTFIGEQATIEIPINSGQISLYEAQKWLREEKEVYVTVIPVYNDYRPVKGVKYRLEVAHWKDNEFGYETIEWLDEECPHTIITFDSYEEALSEGIKEAVKILKENETIHE